MRCEKRSVLVAVSEIVPPLTRNLVPLAITYHTAKTNLLFLSVYYFLSAGLCRVPQPALVADRRIGTHPLSMQCHPHLSHAPCKFESTLCRNETL